MSKELAYVSKSWHRPPGLSRDFRGWAVMRGSVELSLHKTATAAYAACLKLNT